VGLVLEVAAAAMYGYAFVTREAYDSAVIAGNEDDIRTNHLLTNALVGGSIGAATLGATLVVVAF
jgi:hypothetical protein